MYNQMEFIESKDTALNRIVKDAGHFAFFQESKAIEYDKERQCSVTQVGGLLDNKGKHFLFILI